MAASRTGSLFFIKDGTVERSSSMDSEVCRAQIQPTAAKPIGQQFVVQMDNKGRHTAKANQEFLKTQKHSTMVSTTLLGFSSTTNNPYLYNLSSPFVFLKLVEFLNSYYNILLKLKV